MKSSLFAILALASSIGCAGIGQPIESPTIEVQGVSIASASFTGIECDVSMSIFNPNGFGVPLDSGAWELTIGNAHAVSGAFKLSQTIPAKQSAPLVSRIRIDARDAIAVAREVAGGAHTYQIRGQLHFTTSFGDIDVAYSHSGDLEDAQKLIGLLDVTGENGRLVGSSWKGLLAR
jgi:LEA14-like dessication related protein